ncbi:hypothetical protein DV737_g5291, partial [Chaetothyriales sp. CBS 132003]
MINMAAAEDPAAVLDQFVYDAANLPAEIMHMMDEIQAKDSELNKYQSAINSRDSQIQKMIKSNGVLEKHPKEVEYSEQIKKNYEQIAELQNQKVVLSERASVILDQQLKKLDTAIRQLQNDGQLTDVPLPSIFNRKAEQPKALMDIPTTVPLGPTPYSALNASAHRLNTQIQPSNLRQSSLGPGTPKAGTPTAGGPTTSRAGSVPRTLTAPQQGNSMLKKSGLSHKVLNQHVTKLKNKHTKHARLSSAHRKATGSPSVRGARAGTATSEGDDSVLSSADASDTDASQSLVRRGQKKRKDKGNADNDDCRYQWFHTGCLHMKKVPEEDEVWFCPECVDDSVEDELQPSRRQLPAPLPAMASTSKNELTQQAAIAAAQDPNSKVTAADAERAVLEESKKAGAVALVFDPKASTEEKARQAKASAGDLKPKVTKAVGIATDLDDGKPAAYDLPPPSSKGALAAPAAGDKQANGGPPEQAGDWSKTGWAPRFGSGDKDGEGTDDRTLLDHQTLVEAHLDEKFFGDWYHNAGVIVFVALATWAVTRLGGGIGWVLLILAAAGTYYRTSLRRVRRNFRDDITRELAKNRLETDVESLEWINGFLDKFWPVFAPQMAQQVIQSVDQALTAATPGFLDSMSMKLFTLGTKPPRLDHVKSYPRTEDDIIAMDWKFSFTPTDTLDMTARQLKNKVNPKIVLEVRVGKAMVSKGLDVIVEDFAFSGLMRVRIKLQLAFPHIERVDICFLERPEFDYVCKPLGGDTFGFDMNFIPGLEGFIKEQVHGSLGPMMYAPNVFPIEVAKIMAGSAVDVAIGVVAVTIHGANSLKNTDQFAGTPDPYVVVSLNNSKELGRTKTVKENASPRFNETFYIIITSFTDSLTLVPFDFNELRKDKELGIATFPLERLEEDAEQENVQLEVLSNGKARGLIQADVRFFPVLEGQKSDDGKTGPPPESNTGIARLTFEQAKELDSGKSMIGQLNPYGVLLLNGKEIHVTDKAKRNNNPLFSNPTKSVLITDRKKTRIGLVIKDSRDLAADPILGTYQLKIDDLIRLSQNGQEWFNLVGAKTGRAKLLLDWKPVALKGIAGGSGGYITPIGVIRIHVKGARDLRNYETVGKSDPYARVLLSGILKGRTVTFQNELNPTWDEVIYVPVHSATERLQLEVMDEENLGKDRSLGLTQILASDYIRESDDGGYLVHDAKTPLSEGLRLNGRGDAKGKLDFTVAFYPTLNVIDPEEEEEERKAKEEAEKAAAAAAEASSKDKSKKAAAETAAAEPAAEAEAEKKEAPKVRIEVDDLSKYESGFIVFKIIEGTLARSDVFLEILVDDHVFPSYTTSKIKSGTHQIGETGDAFVREIDVSRITLRLVDKAGTAGKKDEENKFIAKLSGSTLATLQQGLYKPTQLSLKHSDGQTSRVTFQLKYLPVQMKLDASESINNMGQLRVDVVDGADLPAADRNGYSDPIAADFRCDVYDWDFGDSADFLGGAKLPLDTLEPFQPQEVRYPLDGKSGVIRLKLLFRPDYITRQRLGSTGTFAGTLAPAGKIVGAPVKGVTMVGGGAVKGVGMVGGGVVKGASFLRRGFRSGSKEDTTTTANGTFDEAEVPSTPNGPPALAVTGADGALTPTTPSTPHARTKSSNSIAGGTPKGSDSGTASFTIVQATGYPPSAAVRVHVKLLGARGGKELFKTKAIKSPTGVVEYDASHESFKVNCAADAHGSEQQVKAGVGAVTVRSSFSAAGNGYADSPSGRDSPDSRRDARRSFFSSRREASAKYDGLKE